MAERAHVSSVEAIEGFRAGLINYIAKTRPLLEDAIDDVHRTRQWLQHDRRTYWEAQLKRRRKLLEEAEQAVFSARLASLREVSTAENAAVARAKRSVTEAEDKLRLVKRWTMEFDNRVEPLVKQLEQLRTALANTIPKGAAHLAQIIKTLDAYRNVAASASVAAPTTPSGGAESAADSDDGQSGATGQQPPPP